MKKIVFMKLVFPLKYFFNAEISIYFRRNVSEDFSQWCSKIFYKTNKMPIIFPLSSGNIISSHKRLWKCLIHKFINSSNFYQFKGAMKTLSKCYVHHFLNKFTDRAERHDFWWHFLLFHYSFLLPSFFMRIEKGGKE